MDGACRAVVAVAVVVADDAASAAAAAAGPGPVVVPWPQQPSAAPGGKPAVLGVVPVFGENDETLLKETLST